MRHHGQSRDQHLGLLGTAHQVTPLPPASSPDWDPSGMLPMDAGLVAGSGGVDPSALRGALSPSVRTLAQAPLG